MTCIIFPGKTTTYNPTLELPCLQVTLVTVPSPKRVKNPNKIKFNRSVNGLYSEVVSMWLRSNLV